MFTGEKVRLREYRKDDLPLKLSFINDPDISNSLISDIPYPMTLHEEEKWFESLTSQSDTYRFAIETIENSRFIGGCSINDVDWKNSVATIGIFIGDKSLWGKGYATDAMNVLIQFIFHQMNINKIRLVCYSFNKGAIRLYEKLGFSIEGILRQEVNKNGQYYDKVAMGILRAEYLLNLDAKCGLKR